MKTQGAKRIFLLNGADNYYLVLDPDFPGCIGQGEKEPMGMVEGLEKDMYKHRTGNSFNHAVGFCKSYRESAYPDVFWGRTWDTTLNVMKAENPDKEQVERTPLVSGEQCAQILEKIGFQRIATPDAVPGHLRFCFYQHIFIEDKSTSAIVSIPKGPQLDRLALIYLLATLRIALDDFIESIN
ncbi:MAG: hypothetical protein ACYDBJ_20435 [Aggregatilineales bacterium]